MAQITHQKTNNISDWTQADLDVQIAAGNYPTGTLLADIVLPSDWNDDHTFVLGADENFVTDAQLTVIGNTSGTNTGDQNLFSTIAVSGQSNVVADTASDTLTLVAGSNVTITTDAATDTITIAASGGGGGAPTDASYVTLGTNGTLTDERVLTSGTGISITDNGAGSTVTVASTITQYTDEMAQDAVGGILVDSSEIDFTYNDGTPSITASIVSGSIDETKLDTSVNASLDLADTAVQPAALASYVPYTGATGDVTFGTYKLTASAVQANGSGGGELRTNSGAVAAHWGSGGSANGTLYGGWNYDNATANTVAVFGASKTISSSSVTNTELGYISGLTSSAQTQINGKISSTEKGAANGVAPLGSDSKISTTYLPAAVLGAANYQGVWNANTNSPTLVSSTGTKGYYYVVDTAGSTNLDGVTDWKLGDWAIFNGTAWEKVDNTDAVISVNSQIGAVVLDADDIDDSSTTHKFTTAGDISKLAGIETGADVTDAANVAAAGALMTSSLGTGVATALGVNIGSAGALVVFNGALGTPSSGTLTNCTGLPISTGVSGLGTGVAASLAVNIGAANKFPTVNAGGTALEYTYSANQNLQTVDAVTFDDLTITDTIKTSGNLVGLNGRTSPECALDILINVDANRAIQLYNSDTALSDGERVASIYFKQNDTSFPDTVHASIDAVTSGSTGSLSLSFRTGASGVMAERFKLSPSGVTTFPSISTTASAANAFLDSGASNSLLRSTSSARYKRNIEDLSPDFSEKIYSMRPVWYRSKAVADNPDWSYFGLIAEEMHEIEPRLVHYTHAPEDYEPNDMGDPVLKQGATPIPDGIQYERLTVLLLAEVQKLRREIDELKR